MRCMSCMEKQALIHTKIHSNHTLQQCSDYVAFNCRAKDVYSNDAHYTSMEKQNKHKYTVCLVIFLNQMCYTYH